LERVGAASVGDCGPLPIVGLLGIAGAAGWDPAVVLSLEAEPDGDVAELSPVPGVSELGVVTTVADESELGFDEASVVLCANTGSRGEKTNETMRTITAPRTMACRRQRLAYPSLILGLQNMDGGAYRGGVIPWIVASSYKDAINALYTR
jgi:hypothetical protein